MLKKLVLHFFLFLSFLPASSYATDQLLEALQKGMPGVEIGKPTATPIKGIYQVKIGSKFTYVNENGKFAFVGNLIDLGSGINLTAQAEAVEIKALLKTFPENDMIFFKAEGEEKRMITVFTDTSCPYCRKLHEEVPQLQQSGVSVRYIPFARGMQKGPGYGQMKSVWCAENREHAMDVASGVTKEKLQKKDCDVDNVLAAGHALGQQAGVQGTPTIFLADGSRVGGYLPAPKLLEKLSLAKPAK